MSSKCLKFECQYNRPVFQSKTARNPLKKKEKHFAGHCKIGRRKKQQTSGRCILGAFKRNKVCKEARNDPANQD